MPRSLLEHGASLGDAIRFDNNIVKSGQKRNARVITPGRCGFLACNEDRVGGVWEEGGSYLCETHKRMLFPLRIKKREGLRQREQQKALDEMSSED